PRTPQNFLLHCGIWREGNVVLVTTLLILALSQHDAHDAKREILNAYGLTYGISAGEKVVGNRLSNHQNPGGCPHIRIRKKCSALHRPLANIGILFTDALQGSVPVQIARDQLTARVDRWRDHRHTWHLAFDGVEIFHSKSVGAAVTSGAT